MNNKRRYIIQCVEIRPSGITTVTATTEYNLLDSFDTYSALTPIQLSELSDSEYLQRLNDFIDFIGTIDLDIKNQLIFDSTFFDPTCIEPVQIINVNVTCDPIVEPTTTEAPTTTEPPTTTEAPTTTTEAPTTTEPPLLNYSVELYFCGSCIPYGFGIVDGSVPRVIGGYYPLYSGEVCLIIAKDTYSSPTHSIFGVTSYSNCEDVPCI